MGGGSKEKDLGTCTHKETCCDVFAWNYVYYFRPNIMGSTVLKESGKF